MRKTILIILLTMLLFTGTASAAFVTTDFNRSPNYVLTGLNGTWNNACVVFTWDAAAGADFNNYVVRTTSNNPAFNGIDTNTNRTQHVLCTVQDGQWVRGVVYRIDGNSDGLYLNSLPDANVLVDPGNVTQAGQMFMFNLMTNIGIFITLLIIVMVTTLFLEFSGINISGWIGRRFK